MRFRNPPASCVRAVVGVLLLAPSACLPPRAAWAQGAAAPGSFPALSGLSDAIEGVSAAVGPSVVQIFSSGYAPALGEEVPAGALVALRQSTGSGVILDAAGYVVTNLHVVEGARRVQVLLPTPRPLSGPGSSVIKARGRLLGAQVVGTDRETDLALLKINADGLPALELGDSDELRQGELVLAFGSPLGLANSATLGVVSSVARQLAPDDPVIYIQTDAPINPGNSGGPLVDSRGRVVGITTFILSQSGGSEGLGFALPSNIVRNVVQQLQAQGRVRRGEIGVHAQTITPLLAQALGLPQDWGVVLADVHPGGPAAGAGLNVGDIVLSLDGKLIENGRQLDVNIYRRAVGDQVAIELLRGGQRLTLRVPVTERPDDPQRLVDMVHPDQNLIPRLGVLALDLSPRLGGMLPALRYQAGVVVAATSPGSPYPEEHFAPGDVIYSLNGKRVTGLKDLRETLAGVSEGQPGVFHLQRQGQLRYVAFVLE